MILLRIEHTWNEAPSGAFDDSWNQVKLIGGGGKAISCAERTKIFDNCLKPNKKN